VLGFLALLGRVLHIVAIVLFLGCGFGVSFIAADEQRKLLRASDLGAVLSLLTGGFVMWADGLGPTFKHQGWIHLMIGFGVVCAAANGISGARLRRGEPIGGMRTLFVVCALGAIACGVWRFSWF
jgi:hypothetical protein